VASKHTFQSARPGRSVPAATAINEAGGLAYARDPEQKLAQLAATGTFNDTFYGKGTDQLSAIREAADGCSPEFIAQTAVWSRSKGHMKDMPAALAVMLTKADPRLADIVFARVIDNGKMLRNFVQMIRSGAFGRKSLGSGPRRLIRRWFSQRTDEAIFRASIGQHPSLGDVIALARPTPESESRKALFGYLRGHPPEETVKGTKRVYYQADALPDVIKTYEAFKRGETSEVPNVDFRLLASQPLTKEQWAQIALRGGWQMVRMNLNTFLRHQALEVPGVVEAISKQLADPEEIAKARAFPYQLFAAFTNMADGVPQKIRLALQDAAEAATANVESYETPVAVLVDVSGSMRSPITGHRTGATTKMSCVDVAAFVGATLLRRNPESLLVPVDTSVHSVASINPRDSIMTIADRLRRFGGGGTDLGAGMAYLNRHKFKGGLVICVSDNESWVDSTGRNKCHGTKFYEEFRVFQARNPGAKLVCVDLQPYGTTQAPDAPNEVMNIGGFSDAVFEVIGKFVRGTKTQSTDWVSEIKKIDLYGVPATNSAAAGTDDDEDGEAGSG